MRCSLNHVNCIGDMPQTVSLEIYLILHYVQPLTSPTLTYEYRLEFKHIANTPLTLSVRGYLP